MKKFYVPTYVKRMLKRASFAIETSCFKSNYDPSYTILIPKHSIYAQTDTLKKEIDKMIEWGKRMMYDYEDRERNWALCPNIVVISLPQETHYCRQYAAINLYDPLMKRVEHLIGMKPITVNNN